MGGSDGDSLLETTEIRREDGSWHYFDVDLPEPTYIHCIVTISATKILLIGGRNDDSEYLSTVYLLDKTNIGEGWQQKPSLKQSVPHILARLFTILTKTRLSLWLEDIMVMMVLLTAANCST